METEDRIKERLTKLSVKQLNAIDLLITGVSDKEVGEKIGVSRQTVTTWRLDHPAFLAELGKRREEVWGYSADKIRSLLPQAIKVVEDAFNDPGNPNKLKLAMEVVKQSGVFATFKDRQSTDAMSIIEGQIPNKELMTFMMPSESERLDTMKNMVRKIEESDGFQ